MVNPPAGTTIASIQPCKKECPVIIIAKPAKSNNNGIGRLCVRKYERKIDETPNNKASSIIPHSKSGCAKNPSPASGTKVSSNGTTAQ